MVSTGIEPVSEAPETSILSVELRNLLKNFGAKLHKFFIANLLFLFLYKNVMLFSCVAQRLRDKLPHHKQHG